MRQSEDECGKNEGDESNWPNVYMYAWDVEEEGMVEVAFCPFPEQVPSQ